MRDSIILQLANYTVNITNPLLSKNILPILFKVKLNSGLGKMWKKSQI